MNNTYFHITQFHISGLHTRKKSIYHKEVTPAVCTANPTNLAVYYTQNLYVQSSIPIHFTVNN